MLIMLVALTCAIPSSNWRLGFCVCLLLIQFLALWTSTSCVAAMTASGSTLEHVHLNHLTLRHGTDLWTPNQEVKQCMDRFCQESSPSSTPHSTIKDKQSLELILEGNLSNLMSHGQRLWQSEWPHLNLDNNRFKLIKLIT